MNIRIQITIRGLSSAHDLCFGDKFEMRPKTASKFSAQKKSYIALCGCKNGTAGSSGSISDRQVRGVPRLLFAAFEYFTCNAPRRVL